MAHNETPMTKPIKYRQLRDDAIACARECAPGSVWRHRWVQCARDANRKLVARQRYNAWCAAQRTAILRYL